MRFSIRLLTASALSWALAAPALADFSACPQFFAGTPPVLPATAPQKQRALCFDEFAILHSGESRTPLVVAQRLNRALLVRAKAIPRKDNFYEEARLPRDHRAFLRDYRASGLDRGHMAPAADMASENGMAQSFSLANMVPQVSKNNRGPWASIEESTRKYVYRASGDVYVLTGAVFDASVKTIGKGDVRVPSHLYKLVYDPSVQRVWAHWLPNTEEAKVSKPISLEELSRRTGINFYGLRQRP
jgi:endonuclease G